MEHPLDFLNPHENEDINLCAHCDTPCDNTYCSKACRKYDTE